MRLVTALKSGRLSGECGLGMRIGCERRVANDPGCVCFHTAWTRSGHAAYARRVRGRIDVERKERVRVGRRLTNRKGYSRPVVSGSSVNVIANPVRVAPIPKVIAHVPTNIIITTSGVGL